MNMSLQLAAGVHVRVRQQTSAIRPLRALARCTFTATSIHVTLHAPDAQPREFGVKFRWLLNELEASYATLVLEMRGPHSDACTRLAQRAIATVRSSKHVLTLAAACAAQPERSSLRGVDGWLRCTSGDCDTANQLAAVLLGAECACSIVQVADALGTCARPAALTQVALTEVDTRLAWADVVVRHSIARSSSVVLLHREHDARRLASAYKAVRAHAQSTAAVYSLRLNSDSVAAGTDSKASSIGRSHRTAVGLARPPGGM